MESNAIEEGDTSELACKEIVMKEMELANTKNNIRTPKKKFAGEKEPGFPSDT
jgi:hypothetical protein